MSAGGFLAHLRELERAAPGNPPIGRNRRLKDETVRIGQDPSLAFPAGDFAPPRADALRAQVMGLFGPQGPLPLNTTEEVARWLDGGDDSFVAFTDILSTRFLQLFFRAWSDSHAITQYDHPTEDRFTRYVAAVAGVGTPAFRDHDGLPDIARLPMVSLFGGRVRCPVRLRQMIETHLRIEVAVEEHVPLWMEFEPGDTSALGRQGCALGRDMYLGARVQSVNDKIALHLSARSLAEYDRYLPGQHGYRRLVDIVFWYLGRSMVVEVALSLPASEVGRTSLGQAGRLGWMAALSVAPDTAPDVMVQAARFTLDPECPPTREAA